jgi:hypothetical protein
MTPTSRVSPQDPVAALLFGLLGLLGALGLLSRLGITIDQGGVIVGWVMMILASLRAWRDSKKAPLLGTVVVEPAQVLVNGDMPPELAASVTQEIAKAKAARGSG